MIHQLFRHIQEDEQMTLSVTALSENTAGMGDLLAEWGLSLLVETDEVKILLDTGTSATAVHNSDSLGIDLTKIDKIVLSHGHSDHTGGLRDVLRRIKKDVDIIAHPDIWQIKYDRREGKPERYIGIPFQQTALESLGARFLLSREPVKLSNNIWTTGEIPMVTDFEAVDPKLFVKENSSWKPDPVMDDRGLVIKTSEGLVVILGCAHRGMINTIYHAREITGVSSIYGVIGGSHLISASEEHLWQTINTLRELDVKKLALCHCTDLPAISVLAQEFGERFIFMKSGSRIELS
jgi:7,8-dihydropterin-6-yl-methyl-4-(beta-D-ribofuranosyl)aminobenzene 5'-phosphate synthase